MAGDYTRFTHRPQDARSGVLLQQGRVTLDADFNELVELLDRRFRAETVDIIGRCGVPRQTIDGFRIQPSGTNLTIGIGRCYVDGLLAENRGTGAERFEDVWGERGGTDPTPYDAQPYYRPALALPGGDGPHLAYLDVWQREVTAAEDPGLVEPAVGVDTATRLQTVWAVRVLADVGAGTTCDADPQAWLDATAPSGGRLTTADIGVAAPADPCLVQPTSGYRGVENQLYRVEIHDDGTQAGRALSFKWSRDNGSVAVPVLGLTGPGSANPRVRVQRIGRDSILRFGDGDWVELLDDALEFAGRPGVMARVAPNGVDEQANELTLTAALDGAIDTARNPRIRRWDQRDHVNARGVVEVGALPAVHDLESGVQATFDADGAEGFHVADHWAFAARTTGRALEILTREPPRGIRHHFCKLALVRGDDVTDCRTLYPPEIPEHEGCDCDVCVTPESHADGSLTIQDAVAAIGKRGGKVCLAVGEYRLREPVRVRRARSLTITGKGRRTVLVAPRGGPAIDIEGSLEVTVEHLAITSGGKPDQRVPEVGIAVRSTAGTTIQRCFVTQAAGLKTSSARVAGGVGIGLAGLLAETVIRENVMLADIGVGTLVGGRAADPQETVGRRVKAQDFRQFKDLQRYLVTHGLWIEDNLLACRRAGIDLGRAGTAAGTKAAVLAALPAALLVHLGDTRLAGNAIYGASEVGIVVSGLIPDAERIARLAEQAAVGSVLAAGPFGPQTPLVLAAGSRLDVCGNLLSVRGYGITVGCDGARIDGNDLASFAPEATAGDGILLFRGVAPTLGHAQVTANRIAGFGGNGIAIEAAVGDGLIKCNMIDGARDGGIVMAGRGLAEGLTVENNEVFDIAGAEGEASRPLGLLLRGVDRLDVVGNVVDGVGANARTSRLRAGIAVLACRTSRVAGNQVRRIGGEQEFTGIAAGIIVDGGYRRCEVAGNVVPLTGGVGGGRSLAPALLVGDPADLNEVVVTRAVGKTVIVTDSGTVVIAGEPAGEVEDVDVSLGVTDNVLDAAGRAPAAWIDTTGRCAFSDNRCRIEGEAVRGVAEVSVEEGSAIADANHLSGPREESALSLHVGRAQNGLPAATVLGNVSGGQIFVNGVLLGAPWAPLNIMI